MTSTTGLTCLLRGLVWLLILLLIGAVAVVVIWGGGVL